MGTFVYKRYLRSKGLAKKVFFYLRKLIILLGGDPACNMLVFNRVLAMPLSHEIAANLSLHEYYDRLPSRIANFVRDKCHFLKCIDVGANVGDSIAAFECSDTDHFIAIEPNLSFKKFLDLNWGANQNIKTISTICSSGEGFNNYKISEKGGTASIAVCAEGEFMASMSLDAILELHGFFSNSNVLKIDTDGYDFQVIAGAKNFISKYLPAILFECGEFANGNFINDFLNACFFFKEAGYSQYLVYDNKGYLMGIYSLADLKAQQNLLTYLINGGCSYYDILVMVDKDLKVFYQNEIGFFMGSKRDELLNMGGDLV